MGITLKFSTIWRELFFHKNRVKAVFHVLTWDFNQFCEIFLFWLESYQLAKCSPRIANQWSVLEQIN